MKSRLVLPDGSSRALNWTNRHPNQATPAGLVLFRHTADVLDAESARRVIAEGGQVESTHPERIRKALGFMSDEPGIVEMEKGD